jgi:hypothetical protein
MFTRILTRKNGRQYLYVEERYREGGKVRSRSRCLGPVSGETRQPGWLRSQFPRTYGLDWDKIEQEMATRADREKAKTDAFAARMYLDYGMSLKTHTSPVEKVSTSVAAPPSSDQPPASEVSASAAPDASPAAQDQPSEQSPSDVDA